MRNKLEQALDKLTSSTESNILDYSRKYPDTRVSYKGYTYINGERYENA